MALARLVLTRDSFLGERSRAAAREANLRAKRLSEPAVMYFHICKTEALNRWKLVSHCEKKRDRRRCRRGKERGNRFQRDGFFATTQRVRRGASRRNATRFRASFSPELSTLTFPFSARSRVRITRSARRSSISAKNRSTSHDDRHRLLSRPRTFLNFQSGC